MIHVSCGMSSIMIAFCCRKVATLMRIKNASLDVLCPYPVHHKILFGNQTSTEQFEYNDTSFSSKPISPLIYAIRFGDLHIVRRIIEKGASVNFCDSQGRTPLMIAVDQVRAVEHNCSCSLRYHGFSLRPCSVRLRQK